MHPTNPFRYSAVLFLVFLVGSTSIPSVVQGQVDGSVTACLPRVHPTSGGTRIAVYGHGFVAGMGANLVGSDLTDIHVWSDTVLEGTVPAKPAGVYDLVVTWPGGGFKTLLRAVETATMQIPPVSELLCTLEGDTVRLSWSRDIYYDSYEVWRGDELLASRPSTYLYYTDTPPDGASSTYKVIGILDGQESAPATCYAEAVDCPPQLVSIVDPSPGPYPVHLRGDGRDEVVTQIELPVLAPDGLRIQALSQRVGPLSAQLRARIRSVGFPAEFEEDGIVLDYQGIAAGSSWYEGLSEHLLLPGSYLIGFYVEGGDPEEIAFEIEHQGFQQVTSSAAGMQGASLSNFYAAAAAAAQEEGTTSVFTADIVAKAYPRIGPIPFEIGGIRVELVSPYVFGGGYFPDEPVPESTVILTPELVNSSGNPVPYPLSRLEWNFGDGALLATSSPQTMHAFPGPGTYPIHLKVIDFECRSQVFDGYVEIGSFFQTEPASGPPQITQVTPDPRRHTILALPTGVPVTEKLEFEYRFLVTPARDTDGIQSVQLYLLNKNDVAVQSFNAEPLNPDEQNPQKFWRATVRSGFGFSVESSRVTLQIKAKDNAGRITEERFPMSLCRMAQFFERDELVLNTVTYDPDSQEYEVTSALPITPLFDYPVSLPYFSDIQLQNRVELRFLLTHRLRDRKWTINRVGASIEATFLDTKVASFQWSKPLTGYVDNLASACGSHMVIIPETQIIVTPTAFDFTDLISESYDHWAYDYNADLDIWGSYQIRGMIEGFMLSSVPGQLRIDVEPFANAVVIGRAGAGLLSGFWSIDATVSGSLQALLPIQLDVTDDDHSFGFVNPCVCAYMEGRSTNCSLWGLFCNTNTGILVDDQIPSGCVEAVSGAGGELPPFGGRFDVPVLESKAPALATSPDGRLSLLVHVENTAAAMGGYEPRLYSSLGQDGSWSRPERIWNDDYPREKPQVAFISEDRAVAVWVQTRLTFGELQTARTPDANVDMSIREIGFAFWSAAKGWGAPQTLTNDDALDTVPVVAPVLADASAWVAWSHADVDDFVVDDEPNFRSLSVYATRIRSDGTIDRPVNVSEDDEGTDADLTPAIAASPDGGTVHVIWIRDEDADLYTSEDRFLRHAIRSDAGWRDPVSYPPRGLGGIMTPSIALSSDYGGAVSFAATPVPTSASRLPAFGQNIYVATLTDEGLGKPAPVEAIPMAGHERFRRVRGQHPKLYHVEGDTFAVLFRSFAGATLESKYGEVAVSVFDAADEKPRPSFARQITSDDEMDAEIVGSVLPSGDLMTASTRSTDGFRSFEAALSDVPMGPDLAVESLFVSDPHAAPGQRVGARVLLHNRGLRSLPVRFVQPPTGGPLVPEPNVTVRLGKLLDGDRFVELESQEVVFGGGPDAVMTVDFPMIVPSTPLRLAVRATAVGDIDTTNNEFAGAPGSTFGVRPPGELQCATESDEGTHRVLLVWTNGESYDRVSIYRDGMLVTVLSGSATVFEHEGVELGEYAYEVRGHVGGGRSVSGAVRCSVRVTDESSVEFVRGNANGDTNVDISDAIYMLNYLFLGGADLPCKASGDSNGDGAVDISDGIHLLNFLFLGGARPAAPYPSCGPLQGKPDEALGCRQPPPGC